METETPMKTTPKTGLIAETADSVELLEMIRREHATVNDNLRLILATYREINAATEPGARPAKAS
ncbi:MAG: hypothetical protein B7Z37_24070 [Verrucomicrobia bacterium 12-59-8]|nr:MAG: hypothetical protein B7Z37_24070 [Verrucomicrobia bacterium 12-59-8]